MDPVVVAIVVLSSIWVFADAGKLGVHKLGKPSRTGRINADMGPVGWALCCLLLWIVTFPLYLLKRPGFKQRHAAGRAAP